MDSALPRLLLRLGLGFVFLYAALASFFEPVNWIGFFPVFVRNLVPDSVLLGGFSLFEIAIALWLLWGRKIFVPSVASAVLLLGITVTNFGALDIVFRDAGLFFAALALASLSR